MEAKQYAGFSEHSIEMLAMLNSSKVSPMYLVGSSEAEFGELEFSVVEAADEKTAIAMFIQDAASHNEFFLENVYARSVNMSFGEHFWISTKKETEQFMQDGEIIVTEEEFKQRVRDFFSTHPDFAELYIDFWFDLTIDETPEVPFPPDMMVFIWVNTKYSDTIAVRLDSLHQVTQA